MRTAVPLFFLARALFTIRERRVTLMCLLRWRHEGPSSQRRRTRWPVTRCLSGMVLVPYGTYQPCRRKNRTLFYDASDERCVLPAAAWGPAACDKKGGKKNTYDIAGIGKAVSSTLIVFAIHTYVYTEAWSSLSLSRSSSTRRNTRMKHYRTKGKLVSISTGRHSPIVAFRGNG